MNKPLIFIILSVLITISHSQITPEVFEGTCATNSKSTGYDDIIVGGNEHCINQLCYQEIIKAQQLGNTFTFADSKVSLTGSWDSNCIQVDFFCYDTMDLPRSHPIKQGTDEINFDNIGPNVSRNFQVMFHYKMRTTSYTFYQTGNTNIRITTTADSFDSFNTQGGDFGNSDYPEDTIPQDVNLLPQIFSIENKQNESFNGDDSSDVEIGGSVRYILTPVNAANPIDLSTYTVSVLQGEQVVVQYTQADVPSKAESGNTQHATITDLNVFGTGFKVEIKNS